MPEYAITAVERALEVLAAFQQGPDSLALVDLARETGINKTTLLRICSSLERHGYVRRDALNRYRLGPSAYSLGKRYEADVHLDDVVIPALLALAKAVSESTSFHVRSANVRICLYRVDADHPVLDNVRSGARLPLDRGAPGRLLLALDGSPGAVYDEIRSQGYAFSFGDRDPQCGAVAAPVFRHPFELCGAISVSGPQTRFNQRFAKRILPQVLAAAEHASRALGARTPAALPRMIVRR